MSLHQLAQQIQASGRGNDTQLVHMAPAEVRSLRKLAQQHGGDLSINPKTGLPEAGFLEQILPTVVGAGVGIATGNPMLGAAAGGALGMAMNKGSIQSGLMAGLGAYGMGSLGAGLMATGAESLVASPEVMAGALGVPGAATGPGSQAAMLAQQNAGMGIEGLESVRSAAATAPGAMPSAGPSTFDQLQAGYKGTKFDMDFLKKNMFPIGAAAAPLLMGASSMTGQNQNQADSSKAMIRPSTFSQTINPRYGEPGQSQLIQKYTAQEPIAASDFGSRSVYMADGGIAGLAPNNRFLGENAIYPMSNLDHSQYTTSSQLPTSAAARNADYDTPTNTYTGQELPRMADGGSTSEVVPTNMDKWLEANQPVPPPPAYASMPLAPQAQQPSYQAYVAPPTIQPQMAAIQQRYAAPQRQAPEAFQYQAPQFVKYGTATGGGGVGGGSGGSGGGGLGSVPNATGGGSGGLDSAGINALYQQYLGRDADPTGLSVNAGQTADTIRQSILASAEYRAKMAGTPNAAGGGSGGLDSAGINALYQQYLGRPADPTGLNVNAGQSSDTVRQAILASPEYQTNNPSGSIGSLYQELLGRAPDPTGVAANAGQSEQIIRESILASPEYQARVETGQAAQPSNNVFVPYDERQYGVEYPDYVGNSYYGGDGGGANGGLMPHALRYAMGGGISNLGSYSDGGRLLKGPGDGVSDDIPAQIGQHQPARLADGEFVVPARIVSELGNGSTDAGAKRLYAMMARVQQGRTKSVGKDKVAVDSKAYRHLPA